MRNRPAGQLFHNISKSYHVRDERERGIQNEII